MTTERHYIQFAVWPFLACSTAFFSASAQEPAPADLPPGVEVLGRGPIHEAFAEPVIFDRPQALLAPRQPPHMIRELPPDNRPEGDGVLWIPGYWSWDEERNDFIWISGIWRQAPPGRRWLPGYWTEVENAYRWWPGSWIEAAQHEIAYLPAPPESLEIGPASPPPGDEFAWSPGCWQWIDDEQAYVWQPGSWQMQPDAMVCVPAHYCYTPQGVVYVSAYQDYLFEQRGIMFAPVWYAPTVLSDPGYAYCPSFQLVLAQISSCLFVHPRSCHYYFGDYFNRPYRSRGFYPCHTFSVAYRGYDPLFGYLDGRASRRHRDRSTWAIQNFDRLLATPAVRPARLLAGGSRRRLIQGSRGPSTQLAQRVGKQLTQIDQQALAKPQRAAAAASAQAVRAASQTRAIFEGNRRNAARLPSGLATEHPDDRNQRFSAPPVPWSRQIFSQPRQRATNRETQVESPVPVQLTGPTAFRPTRKTRVVKPVPAQITGPTGFQRDRGPTQTYGILGAKRTGNSRRLLPPASKFQLPSVQPQVRSQALAPGALGLQTAPPVPSPFSARAAGKVQTATRQAARMLPTAVPPPARKVQMTAPPPATVPSTRAVQGQHSANRQFRAGGSSGPRRSSGGHGGKDRK